MQLNGPERVFELMEFAQKGFRINRYIEVVPSENTILFGSQRTLLEPRIMRLLTLLCSEKGKIFLRSELIEEIWANKWVGEEGLTKAVSILRKALGDPYLIKTIPKQGYLFVGEISERTSPKTERTTAESYRKMPSAIKVAAWLLLIAVFPAFLLSDFSSPEIESSNYEYAYLTDNKGLHLSPTLSADGKLVAYVKRNENERRFKLIVKSTSSGAIIFESSVTNGDYLDPVFSPAGDFLAFVNKEAGYTYLSMVLIFGGEVRNIYQTNARADPGIDWSSDGEWLIFNDKTTTGEGHDLFMYHISTGRVEQITDTDFDDVNPVFSPDGRQVAFIQQSPSTTQDNICIYDFDSKQHRVIKKVKTGLYDLDWSKNGKRILFTATNGFDPFIHAMNIADGLVSQVSNQNFHQLSVNANSHQMVASTYNQDNNVWMTSLESSGTTAEAIINSNRHEFKAAISPDQAKVAYISDLSGRFQLWLYNAKTGKSEQLSFVENQVRFDKISWSADGRQLLTGYSTDEGVKMLHINLANKQTRILLADEHVNRFPQFGASDSTFYFLSDRSGKNELWEYDFSTHRINQISRISENIAYAKPGLNKTLYFTQVGKEGIWKSGLSGEGIVKLSCKVAISDHDNWELFSDGIYFLDRMASNPAITYLAFKDYQEQVILTLPPQNRSYNSSISVSEDRKKIIYNQIDHFQSDIVLLQNKSYNN